MVRIEQGELLLAVGPVLGVVDIEHDPPGHGGELSQNNSTITAIMRLSATVPGRFSSRVMVGWKQRSGPVSGRRPAASLKSGSRPSAAGLA